MVKFEEKKGLLHVNKLCVSCLIVIPKSPTPHPTFRLGKLERKRALHAQMFKMGQLPDQSIYTT